MYYRYSFIPELMDTKKSFAYLLYAVLTDAYNACYYDNGLLYFIYAVPPECPDYGFNYVVFKGFFLCGLFVFEFIVQFPPDGVSVDEDAAKQEGLPDVVDVKDVAPLIWDVKVSASQASGRQVLV
ncbi:hypothetical protein VNO77_34975 [Canavalia gladiata]|uniref:Uncharacterized protein n=1 Tax=Canavalia gladiata TaxID=3824 RepID=A0AAN9Q234_CANGL